MGKRKKPKFKPQEMELCRVADEDGDVFIVYKDNTAIFDVRDESVDEAEWITWKLEENNEGMMCFYYIYSKSLGSSYRTDYYNDIDYDNEFELKLVESIQMALIGEQIEEVLSEKTEV